MKVAYRRSRDEGSALIITMVITIIAAAMSVALLTDTFARGKWSRAAIEKDEARAICDAGLSRARRALFLYRENGTWDWNDLLAYNSNLSTDPNVIRTAYQDASETAWFTSYRAHYSDTGVHTSTDLEAPVPPDAKSWSYKDVDYSSSFEVSSQSYSIKLERVGGFVQTSTSPENHNFFGFNQPYLRGAFHVVVTDNDDGDGSLLTDSDNQVLVTVTATLPGGVQTQIEAFVEYPVVTMNFTGMAAVVSNADVDVLGNIEVDGRDYDTNNLHVDDGVEGIVSAAAINRTGNAIIGGNGVAPSRPTPGGTTVDNYGGVLPATPDEVVNLSEGKLKAVAQASGTYFATEAAYDAFKSANGGDLPGGKIYYLEFDFQNPTTFGRGINTEPSIMVIHNSTNTASAKNIHGQFKGLLIVDVVDKVNAGTLLLGSVYCLSTTASNHWGNGNADVHYSSEVLANLPSGDFTGGLNLISYRKTK